MFSVRTIQAQTTLTNKSGATNNNLESCVALLDNTNVEVSCFQPGDVFLSLYLRIMQVSCLKRAMFSVRMIQAAGSVNELLYA